ncbi:MAG: GNAT family N-acetyltransferase [Bacteroidales bacterium]|jgi:diamine N-acetyltransferase|nr:GNAT family N-acetyltransferase [Bacteroidales bacterium]
MIGNKVYLRALEPSDLELLYQWENSTDVWPVSQTLAPFSKYTLKEFIRHLSQDIYTAKQLRLMIDELGSRQTVGIVDLFDIDPLNLRTSIGILIVPEFRRKGYASEALQLIVNHVFKRLCLHQVYCNVMTDNEASLRLFARAGFTIAGTKKDWQLTSQGFIDEYILQRLNG